MLRELPANMDTHLNAKFTEQWQMLLEVIEAEFQEHRKDSNRLFDKSDIDGHNRL